MLRTLISLVSSNEPTRSFFSFLPESVRWLNTNGRSDEAEKILHKVAKYNKRTIENVSLKQEVEEQSGYSYLDLFSTTKVLKITLSQGYIW